MIDRRTLLTASLAIGVTSMSDAASAKVPLTKAAGPSFQRFNLGEFEITVLSDGSINIPTALTTRLDPARHRTLLAEQMRPDPVPTSLNVFLINTGSQLVLIDTGAASTLGPSLGQLARNLAAAGIRPADVDMVALTHIHPDHSNGLIGADGKAVFSNAELVVGEADARFWLDDANAGRIAKDFTPFFGMAKAALGPYAQRTRTITGAEIVPGISAIAAPGHTPGHTVFMVNSAGKQFLIIGDALHSPATQFAHPEAAVAFDVDQDTAVASRRRVLDMAAADRIPIAGMHLDFPGVGFVQRKDSAFAYTPASWREAL